MTSKSEWVKRAMVAEEKLDSVFAERLELQRKVQELTQDVERLSEENEEHREMAKRWRMVQEVMRPNNGVFAIAWDPRDFDEEENRELVELMENARDHHRMVLRSRASREIEDFAQGIKETMEEDNDGEDR